MKYAKIIILTMLLSSCSSGRISYNIDGFRVKGAIPKKFEKNILTSIHETEYHFKYPDSSIIYITNERGTPSINYHNIDSDSIAIQKSFLSNMEGDTLTLKGVDDNGLHWKNIKIKKGSVGYLNVPKSRKAEFDKAIEKLQIR